MLVGHRPRLTVLEMRSQAGVRGILLPAQSGAACWKGATLLQRRGCRRQGEMTSSMAALSNASRDGRDPMTTLTDVFKAHPSALRLHRELTICLSNGEAKRAADLASVLAETVKRVCKQMREGTEEKTEGTPLSTPVGPSETTAANDVKEYALPVGPEDIEFSTEATRRYVLDKHSDDSAEAFIKAEREHPRSGDSGIPVCGNPPFWKQPSALRVTLLETSFEMTLTDGEDAENPLCPRSTEVEEHEKNRMALLDEYLTREKKRWELQKGAIGRAVLTTAQTLGLTPEHLHSALGEKSGTTHIAGQDGRFSVLKHCNLIIRGEAPEVELMAKEAAGRVRAAAEEELEVLASRMERRGLPLTPQERELALFELVLTKSKMRYVVGLHRELQVALDACEALRREASQQRIFSGSEFFTQKVVEKLNKVAPDDSETSAEDVELIEILSAPVLPFTFMLKMCLWFDVPRDA
ncbi:hypothetical protein TraAM80_04707 [Trypanosoma rangeli]|uniref:Uncharacterized protein n=1 Tax=Trypanosoma rangeli TaxID=5698 RepID=A0A3R7KEY6_TRYRA|nr:uncharacterized protein TraAM80_04707 [Trypanosoma rangeli]RNF05147.1 hypothetical protein TraAM80_04707 [Trypanosoma rangeli]|eukprot:RNF05147.1 hypothetical protein TraAM80_04707 [Trypanosoma rangeli]